MRTNVYVMMMYASTDKEKSDWLSALTPAIKQAETAASAKAEATGTLATK